MNKKTSQIVWSNLKLSQIFFNCLQILSKNNLELDPIPL